jgi:protein-tyrosine-phosphatase
VEEPLPEDVGVVDLGVLIGVLRLVGRRVSTVKLTLTSERLVLDPGWMRPQLLRHEPSYCAHALDPALATKLFARAASEAKGELAVVDWKDEVDAAATDAVVSSLTRDAATAIKIIEPDVLVLDVDPEGATLRVGQGRTYARPPEPLFVFQDSVSFPVHNIKRPYQLTFNPHPLLNVLHVLRSSARRPVRLRFGDDKRFPYLLFTTGDGFQYLVAALEARHTLMREIDRQVEAKPKGTKRGRHRMCVLILCHGNINRSPLFADVLDTGTGGIHEIRSRGFGPSGRRVPKRMRELAVKAGYDLNNHRSRCVTQEDIDWADYIIYMDSGQQKRLREMDVKCKTVCAGSFVGRTTIPDPHFLKGAEFRRAVSLTILAAEAAAKVLDTELCALNSANRGS